MIGLPSGLNFNILYVNGELAQKAGLDLSVPYNWEKVLEDGQKVRAYDENAGYVNMLLQACGVRAVKWFGNTHLAPFIIALVAIWQFGSSMVLFLAALKNVPKELYDAARVDGGGKAAVFFSVTLPMISPILLFNLVMQTINSFQEFTTPFVLTQGGPNKATLLFGMKLYREAFQYFNMGYASAYSWILFAMLIAVTMLIFATSKHWVFYGDDK